jgi:DNA polymerase
VHQDSLFGESSAGADRAAVRFYPDFDSWLGAAAGELRRGRSPAAAWWQPDIECVRERGGAGALSVAFTEQARAASCHSAADRWALLYAIAWRLQNGEPHLMSLAGDADVARLHRYAKAVRRDVHKMKAFVRFRAVPEPAAPDAEPRYVAWFEPEHHIVEYAAPFFQRRFSNMRWSILTPSRCAHWEGGGRPWFSGGVDKSAAPDGDRFEDAWRVYYRSIFNPARLKTRAMMSEMPQKYWRNLPEAALIPELVRDADRRVAEMEAARKSEDTLRCGPRPASPARLLDDEVAGSPAGSLQRLALEASRCRACPLWEPATQTVFGEGPANARIVIVGEQPGDQEDLAGRPFVGPAGRLLDRALAQAGLDRDALYLTNAVKHFGFRPSGKRRLHQKPTIESVRACMSWLRRELDLVDPALVVYLGATAASTEFGADVRVGASRGRLAERGGRLHLVTAHPSSVLRAPDGSARERAFAALVDDLRLAVAHA